jgi:dihydropteroate synthase
MGELYIRPAGLVYGPDAGLAVNQRAGLMLAGNPSIAWTAALVSDDGGSTWQMRKVQALAASSDADVKGWINRLGAARPDIAGLPMSEPQVMAIVNVTPDSFSEQGVNAETATAITSARRMAMEGASVMDVGGESTRPGSDAVDAAEEWQRIEPVIAALVGDGLTVSCDTRKASIMRKAKAAGVGLLNDVSALAFEPEALPAAVESGLPVCLMHAQGDPKTMQQNPTYDNVLTEVYDWLDTRIGEVEAAGIPRGQIIADPGIGFGKSFAHNLQLMQALSLFHGLGVALMLGASRKGFIGAVTGEKVAGDRQAGSAAAALHGVMAGFQIVRVHDVRETVHAVRLWRASTGTTVLD